MPPSGIEMRAGWLRVAVAVTVLACAPTLRGEPRNVVDEATPRRPAAPAPRHSEELPAPPAAVEEVAHRHVLESVWGSSSPRIREPCRRRADNGSCASTAMDRLYEGLAALDAGASDRLVRISIIGDSLTAADDLPASLRDALQRRFGDGGAGFVHIDQPTRWHQEQSGSRHSSHGFRALSVVGDLPADHILGPAAAAFTSTGGSFHVATTTTGAGSRAANLRILYLAMPGGGTLHLTGDGTPDVEVSTTAPDPVQRSLTLFADDSAHSWDLQSTGGPVRIFGADLRRRSGVLVDNLGLVSSSAFALRRLDAPAWSTSLSMLGTDLVMIFLGANDLDQLTADRRRIAAYADEFGHVLDAAAGSGSAQRACLVLSALDVSARRSRTPVIVHSALVEAQREAAERAGCAFFDAATAILDDGGMIGWQRRGYVAGDGIHLTSAGGRRMGERLFRALGEGLARYRRRQARAHARERIELTAEMRSDMAQSVRAGERSDGQTSSTQAAP